VTDWGFSEAEDRRRAWLRKGRKSSWEGEQWIAAQEKKVK
jgi:hypothetical protein